jgi:hypothetical protein
MILRLDSWCEDSTGLWVPASAGMTVLPLTGEHERDYAKTKGYVTTKWGTAINPKTVIPASAGMTVFLLTG